ncbi:efflux RND transporter periplasmic adaptor subunit [Asticcacaulis sp. EMRT-3]|uniref:efflux RND transporter periplasmic adaptor subunit n=1 Tax=Asticcacaulis sp. EMRT-3 TaxID=3040349 RepID=UPI0024AF2ED0|nr:efflux RND transporter periplasmic adaptor subunit [Asticcacaulis sp. EMRT-3]MDI7775086.1 efflux RND transporter periplasmic adaptor subunit [Asticcacaulis sp. EMRT-3]
MVRFKTSLIVLAFAASGIGLSACGHKEEVTQVKAFRGETLQVEPKLIEDVKPVAATLTTRQMGEATARVSGILTSLKVREGDMVTKGQVIGFVTDQRLNLQTGAYNAATSAAEAQASLARAALSRTQTLFDKGIYAQAKLDQDKAAAEAAEANVRAARAQASASGEGARQGAILAPASGRVIHATVPVGSVVMAGQSVATITAGNRVVRLELPEAQSSALTQGQSVSLDAGGVRATGVISEIYPSVTAGQVVADMTAPGLDQVVIGQTVTAFIGVGQRTAIVVPKRFVTTRYGLDYVRLVEKNGALMETMVQTAPTGDPDEIEILGGVSAGDKIAAYGAGQ